MKRRKGIKKKKKINYSKKKAKIYCKRKIIKKNLEIKLNNNRNRIKNKPFQV